MKKILIAVFVLGLTLTAAAQHGRAIAGSRVIIVSPGMGWGFGYSPFYYSPFGYYPYGYPYGYGPYRSTSKLQSQIDDLKNDYSDKIKSAKHDSSLSKDERNKIVQDLKTERDNAVHDLKTNYYKQKKPTQAPATQAPATQDSGDKG